MNRYKVFDYVPEITKCNCGKEVHKSNRFHIYDGIFCSSECMQKYKEIEDRKREKTKNNIRYQEIRIDYGSG